MHYSHHRPPQSQPQKSSRCAGLSLLAVLGVILFAHAATTSTYAAAQAKQRPNILWIFVEDMNGWYSCYGDKLQQTPTLDSLAQRGLRFTRAYMAAGVCSATRSAIAIGAMQTTFGTHNHRSARPVFRGKDMGKFDAITLPKGVKTVYQTFRENDYFVFTQGGGKDDYNFVWKHQDLYDHRGKAMGFVSPIWQKRKKGQPFFGQIQLKGGKNSGKVANKMDPAKVSVPPYYPDDIIYRKQIAHHYDTIKQTDNDVKKILAALKKDNLLDNTIIFFWTDHGMQLPRHKQFLYEGGINVPLIIAGPGIDHAVRDDLVSGIDITAATLALASIARPSHIEGFNFLSSKHKPREYIIAARDRCDYTIERIRAVTTPRYKYLRNYLTDRPYMQPQYRDGRDYVKLGHRLYKEGKLNEIQAHFWKQERPSEELYDLKSDPHETKNLANDPNYQNQLKQHRDILANWIKRTNDQGQFPESEVGLRAVYKRWGKNCVNPEYDKIKKQAKASSK